MPKKRKETEPTPILLLTKSQAARALGVSLRTVESLLAEGTLTKIMIKSSVRVTAESVKKLASA